MIMTEMDTINWTDDGLLEVLTFDVGAETLAIEAGLVREILDPLPETAVPGANPLVEAVINFRGQVIPLANLHVAFGMVRAGDCTDSRMVVIELELGGEAMHLAIRTDRVNEVTTLHRDDAEPPPVLGVRWPRGLLRAMVRRAGDVVLIPDLYAIFQTVVDSGAALAPALV
jgi:purine-binding chemotaxis protein CheW